MNQTIYAHTWTELRLDLPASDQLEIVVPKVSGIIVGQPRLECDGLSLAVNVDATKDGAVIDTADVPETTLIIPVKARPPITKAAVTLTIRVNDRATTFTLIGQGNPRFAERRCRWITPAGFTFGVDASVTARIRNDGTAPADQAYVQIPVIPGLHLDGDVRGIAINGVPFVRVPIGSLDVGDTKEVTLTAQVTDPTLTSVTLKGEVYSGSATAALVATVPVTPMHHASLAITPATFPARVGDRLPIRVHLKNDATTAACALSITSPALEPCQMNLGVLLPYEDRSFTITALVREAGSGKNDYAVSGALIRNDNPIATSQTTCTTSGEAVLDIATEIGQPDATKARQVRLQIRNNGLGAADAARLQINLPSHVFAVRDSFSLDGVAIAGVDGSIPLAEGVDLGSIPIGASRSVALRLRADADGTFEPTAIIYIGTSIAETAKLSVELADARESRVAPSKLESTLTLDATTPLHTNAPTPAATLAQENEPLGPTYRSDVSPSFASFVPNLDSTALGRLVLGLYDFVPTSWPEHAQELASLREAIERVIERYLPGAIGDTFGAAGFDFSTEVNEALNILRSSLGEQAVERDDWRGTIAGVLALADADGHLHDMIAPLRDRVIAVVNTLDDEEAFSEPIGETIP